MKQISIRILFVSAVLCILITGNEIHAQNMSESKIKLNGHVVFMTDFGMKDRFVASMKGVAIAVDSKLVLHDLTHQIEPFNIWEGAYTLAGTIPYWPEGTVFVSVVDPGVGTERRSVVAETRDGKFIVTPDNGTLTLVDDEIGIREVRIIDESINRRPGTGQYATFHGRDIYAFTGARIAAGVIKFEEAGRKLKSGIEKFEYLPAEVLDSGVISGTVVKIEYPYGNPATNIPAEMFLKKDGNLNSEWSVEISKNSKSIYKGKIPFVKSFGHVEEGNPLLYIDSLGNIGLALNGENFSEKFGIEAGPAWQVTLRPAE